MKTKRTIKRRDRNEGQIARLARHYAIAAQTAISHYLREAALHGFPAEQFGSSEAVIKNHCQGRASGEDIKRRNRIERQITKLAQTNADEALLLAKQGRRSTTAENAVFAYLIFKEIHEDKSLNDFDPGGTKRTIALRRVTVGLCKLFLDALHRHDGDALRAITRAAEDYEKLPEQEDRLRADILILKGILDLNGDTMNVKYLSTVLNSNRTGEHSKVPATQDSYSYLRRLAKSLKFPLAKDKIGRPKKADK